MGRVKVKIKRLDNSNSRQVTYSKRKTGVTKKAKELYILCDIDLVLFMFAPNGMPTICVGDRRNTEEVVARFAQVSQQEREKRKLESLEALKKTFKKLDHNVDIQEFLGSSTQTVEEITSHWSSLHAQLLDVQKRLSNWADPDKIDNMVHITTMEQSLMESLGRIQVHKENIGNQLISVDYSGQFQNDIHLSSGLGCEQGASPVSWLHSNDDQQLMLPQYANLLPWRDIGCSMGTSLQNYQAYFSTEKSLQESTIDYQVDHFDASFHNWASTSGTCGVAIYDEQSYTSQS
ncbi:hypothetical protein OPV22_000922 [Ensete ventricosum]|uniref:MADS-box domain-containing protein n=1 Tax=Ensete ventricosum TaxID=4639 RepID=A0AAV8RTY2_ENSVE|nr:hypothetical protein OPV22_000922 [Ensete ventricosum]